MNVSTIPYYQNVLYLRRVLDLATPSLDTLELKFEFKLASALRRSG